MQISLGSTGRSSRERAILGAKFGTIFTETCSDFLWRRVKIFEIMAQFLV